MFSNQPAELLLPTPLRTCAAIPASSKSTSRYLVGTTCPPGGHNVVHLLRYHEEANELGQDAQLDHPTGEVWCLASCPADATVLVTCGGGGGGGAASTKVWRVARDVVEKDDQLGYDDDEEEEEVEDGVPNSSTIGASEVTDMTSQATLFVESDDALGGRISCALFRPTAEDEFGLDGGGGGGSFGMSGGDGAGLGIDSSKDLITVSAYGGTITRWDLEAGAAEVGRIASAASSGPNVGGGGGGMAERRAAWDPHNHNLVAVTGRNGITLHDLRTANGGGGGGGGNAMHLSTDVDLDIANIGKYRGLGNHRYGTTDVSYNPNLPNVLTTSGKDGLIKFWDLRTTSSSSSSSSSYSSSSSGGAAKTKQNGRRSPIRPIKILRGGHNHWSNRVSYNPHHDQLLLSSGTDGVVNLWRVGSVSSAPLLDLDDALLPSEDGGGGAAMTADEDRQDLQTKDDKEDQDGGGGGGGGGGGAGGGAEGGADARVSTFDFPDSVYDITWSASDAWTFLAVGYDGTVALNHVPSREKYKILL